MREMLHDMQKVAFVQQNGCRSDDMVSFTARTRQCILFSQRTAQWTNKRRRLLPPCKVTNSDLVTAPSVLPGTNQARIYGMHDGYT